MTTRLSIKNVDRKRKFTPAEFAQCAKDALENWEWSVELENGNSQAYVDAFKEALTFDADYAEEMWGSKIKLDRAYGDVWDMLDEFGRGMASQI